MQIASTELPEVLVVEPKRFSDARGFFVESWNRKQFADAGLDLDFVQDNHSFSEPVGVLRGLHAQAPPTAQDKLVRVANGRIWDVAVDIRRGSPRYGQWTAREISGENGLQLLIPKGFLHGFVTLEPNTHVLYKTSSYYAPDDEISVRWDDHDLSVAWPISGFEPVVSEKDASAASFGSLSSPFDYEQTPGQ